MRPRNALHVMLLTAALAMLVASWVTISFVDIGLMSAVRGNRPCSSDPPR